jgi:hypothetical protein
MVSQSAEFHKESISKVKAPASVKVSNFAFTGPFQDLNCHTSHRSTVLYSSLSALILF